MCVENGLGRGGHCLCKVSKIETEAIVDLLTFGWILCSVSRLSQVETIIHNMVS